MRRSIVRVCAAIAITLAAAHAHAQTFTSTDPVLKKIWDLGMKQSQTWQLSQALFDSVGPRLYASPGAKASSAWIIGKYKSWGIDAKQESYGTWRSWDRGYMHLDLVQPRVHSMDAMLLPWSPGTGGKDVTGAVVLMPDLKDSAEFLRWLPSVKGKFVLMSPNRATCRPHSEWVSLAPPDEVARIDTEAAKMTADFNARLAATRIPQRQLPDSPKVVTMNERLDLAGPAGIVTTTAGTDAWGTYTVAQTRNKDTPAITMSCEDYSLLYRLVEQHQSPTLRLNSDAHPLGIVPVYNTIATVKGSTKPNEYVMLSAHFDSWDAGTGATDNGTGTIVMLEAMRILRQAYPNPKRTIIAGHWVGEEEGLIGSQSFAADHPEIVKGLHGLFNQDNGTGRVQTTTGAGLPDGGAHMQKWLAQLPKEFQDQLKYNGVGNPQVGSTDHASFDCYGAPAFGLSSAGWDYGTYTHHTNRDTFDKIVFDEVKGNATIVAMLVYLASEEPTDIALTRRDLNQPDPTAPPGGRGGGGRGAAGRGGAAATPPRNVDAMGWPATCPKGPRASPDTAKVRG